MNVPYVKQYDKNGSVINEITRANPYLASFDNRKKKT